MTFEIVLYATAVIAFVYACGAKTTAQCWASVCFGIAALFSSVLTFIVQIAVL